MSNNGLSFVISFETGPVATLSGGSLTWDESESIKVNLYQYQNIVCKTVCSFIDMVVIFKIYSIFNPCVCNFRETDDTL